MLEECRTIKEIYISLTEFPFTLRDNFHFSSTWERENRQRFVDFCRVKMCLLLRFSIFPISSHRRPQFSKQNMLAERIREWRKLSFMLECDLCYKLNGDDDDESNHVAHKKLCGDGVNGTSKLIIVRRCPHEHEKSTPSEG